MRKQERKGADRTILSTWVAVSIGLALPVVAAAAPVPNRFANVGISGNLISGKRRGWCLPHIHRPVRGHLRPQRDRVCLRRHHPERLQPGPHDLHRVGSPELNGVYVETKNQGGGLDRRAVPPAGRRPRSNTKFAVVGYWWNLIRADVGHHADAAGLWG